MFRKSIQFGCSTQIHATRYRRGLRNARRLVYAACRPNIGLHHATSMSSRGCNSRHRGLVCTRIGGTDGKSLGNSIDTLAKISQAMQLGLRTRKRARSTTIPTRNTSPRPTSRFVWRRPPQRPDATKRESPAPSPGFLSLSATQQLLRIAGVVILDLRLNAHRKSFG